VRFPVIRGRIKSDNLFVNTFIRVFVIGAVILITFTYFSE